MNINKRLWLYLGLLLLALGTMYLIRSYSAADESAGSAKPSGARDYSEVKAEGKLRLLAPYSLTQVDSLSPDNLPRLINHLKSLSKLEVELKLEDNTHKALEQLLLGEVDLVLQPVAQTAELDSSLFVWIQQHVAEPIYLVQRKGDSIPAIRKQLELEQKTITLARESYLKLFIKHLNDEMGMSVQVQEDSLYNTEQLIMKVGSSAIDYTLCSGEEAKRYAARFPELDFGLPISHNLRRGWLARRSSPQLADSLKRWLSTTNPTRNEQSSK